MATDLTPAAPSAPEPAPVPAERFRLATAGLIGLAVAALVIAAALLASRHAGGSAAGGESGPLNWSTWKPAADGNEGAAEIADYIAPYYRLSSATQLTVISPVNTTQLNPSTGGFTGSGLTVAIRLAGSGTNPTSSLRPLPGRTVAYDLCGQGGPDCQLGGTPSRVRLLLLRRQALELALYTLEYLKGIQNVVAVLPPGHTAPSRQATGVTVAVLLTRGQLLPLLQQPLSASLQSFPPSVSELPSWARTQEAGLVDTVTARNLFSEQTEAEQTGGNLLVLNPLPAQ